MRYTMCVLYAGFGCTLAIQSVSRNMYPWLKAEHFPTVTENYNIWL